MGACVGEEDGSMLGLLLGAGEGWYDGANDGILAKVRYSYVI